MGETRADRNPNAAESEGRENVVASWVISLLTVALTATAAAVTVAVSNRPQTPGALSRSPW